MMWIIKKAGQAMGIQFVGDNCVVPVMRMGRMHRIQPTGFFWAVPGVDKPLPEIQTGIQSAEYQFDTVMSQDNIPFTIAVEILFSFDPRNALPEIQAQVLKLPRGVLGAIVRGRVDQALRRGIAVSTAECVCSAASMSNVERSINLYVKSELGVLGIAPLQKNAVIIKEAIPPEKFKQMMLQVRQQALLMETYARYRSSALAEQAISAGLWGNLDAHKGPLTLVPPMWGVYGIPPLPNVDARTRSGPANGVSGD